VIFEKIRAIPAGTALPGRTTYTVKGIGERRGQPALVYRIPRRPGSRTRSEKGVTAAEFEQAYKQLVETGEITRKWFKANMSACAKNEPCNFTVIGRVFVMLGEAVTASARGRFMRRDPKPQGGD
jgi:hypothetical protein